MNYILINLFFLLNSFNFVQNPVLDAKTAVTPKIFEKYPLALHFQSNFIDDLISRKKDESVSVSCTENFAFKGTIIQNIQWNDEAQTIAIKLDSFPSDTKLVINKISKDGKIIYKAHILNIHYPDAFQLVSYDSSGFVFNKISRENIVTE